ncbi:MAG: hypothetical protein CEO21_224 [Microgenomates group bacterium Gr01-1014_80]|nr:MAG: hypothetical protein CEO21_224 [Microgenomates group bacterium Gr01-1014_80]
MVTFFSPGLKISKAIFSPFFKIMYKLELPSHLLCRAIKDPSSGLNKLLKNFMELPSATVAIIIAINRMASLIFFFFLILDCAIFQPPIYFIFTQRA